MNHNLPKQKFAVVTGASTGIGRAISIELAKQGIFIALCGRNERKVETADRTQPHYIKLNLRTCIFSTSATFAQLCRIFFSKGNTIQIRINILCGFFKSGVLSG